MMPDVWTPCDPRSPRQAHLVGICGAGMKALAEFLLARGWRVTGSDADPEPGIQRSLNRRGVILFTGHAPSHVPPAAELLVYSPAIPEHNVERRLAVEKGIPSFSYVEILGELSRRAFTVAVAGTHGKSSTCGILGTVLTAANRSPSLLCGAEYLESGENGLAGEGDLLVVEACEFRRHFLHLRPRVACLLELEQDHFDCYPNLDATIAAYSEFARSVPSDGVIVFRGDCDATRLAVRDVSARVVSFSLNSPEAEWRAVAVHHEGTGSSFQLQHHQTISRRMTLRVPGKHNILNALAAAACADAVGLSLDEIADGLEAFSGLKRRLEFKREWRNSLVYDDYAHHPSEIQAAISTMREVHPDRPIVAVFQSHQASRTEALMAEFANSLSLADRVYLLPVFAAREQAGKAHEEIAKNLQQCLSVPSVWVSTLDQLWGTLQTDAETSAVILTLGAGNLTRVHHDPLD